MNIDDSLRLSRCSDKISSGNWWVASSLQAVIILPSTAFIAALVNKAYIIWVIDSLNPFAASRWRHTGRDGVSNHQPHYCLLNRLCAGNSWVSGEFPAQMASNAEMFPFDDVIMWARVKDVKCRILMFDRETVHGKKWIIAWSNIGHNILVVIYRFGELISPTVLLIW